MLDWVGARSAALLGRQRLDEGELAVVRKVTGELFEGMDDRIHGAATLARLLYSYGLWDDAMHLVERQLRGKDLYGKDLSESEVSLIRTAMTLAAKSGGERSNTVERLAKITDQFEDPLVRVELSAHALIYLVRAGHSLEPNIRQVADRSIRGIPRKRWLREPRVLRLAILVGAGDVRELLSLYLETMDRLPYDPELLFSQPQPDWLMSTADGGELGEVGDRLRQGDTRGALEKLEMFWSRVKPRLLKNLFQPDFPIADARRLVVFDHSDWIRCLGNSLTRALRDDQGRALMPLLVQSKFAEPRRSARLPGLEIVRSAVDEGRLLEFARNVREWGYSLRPSQSLSVYQPTSCPNDIYSLGESLFRWHEALLELIIPPEPRAAFLA